MTIEKIFHLVTTDFAVSWRDRWAAFEEECVEAARLCGQSGMLGSSDYMGNLVKSGERALSGALDDLLGISTRAIEAFESSALNDGPSALHELVLSELTKSASQVDSKLAVAAKNVGYSPDWTVSTKLDSLKQRAIVEIDLLVESNRRKVQKPELLTPPWYQRPFGVVVLTVVAGLIVAGIVALVG